MLVLRARLTPEVGAVLLHAVQAALEQVPATAAGDEPTIVQRRADALRLVAESALAGGLDPGNPGDRFQVTVHVPVDTLASREPVVAPPPVSAASPPPVGGAAHTVIEQPGSRHAVSAAATAPPDVSAETREPRVGRGHACRPQRTAPPDVSAETWEVSEGACEPGGSGSKPGRRSGGNRAGRRAPFGQGGGAPHRLRCRLGGAAPQRRRPGSRRR